MTRRALLNKVLDRGWIYANFASHASRASDAGQAEARRAGQFSTRAVPLVRAPNAPAHPISSTSEHKQQMSGAATQTEKRPARVRVVIVTYQSRPTIDDALTPLMAPVRKGRFEVVVVDNASTDRTAQYVSTRYPEAKVLQPGANLGFGRGCNLGAAGSETDYILLLNPDAAISEPDVDKLIEFMDARPRVGITAPSMANQQQHAGMLTMPRDILGQAWGLPNYPGRRVIVPGDDPFQTSWVCGAVMLIRTSLYRELHGFDPRFFLYFEETDFCRRATASGAEIWVVPDAVSSHRAGSSAGRSGASLVSGNIAHHFYQSRFYYLAKHHGWPVAVLATLAELPPITLRSLARRGPEGREQRKLLFHRLANGLRPPASPYH